MKKGKFVVSLDFEIFWGVRDMLSMEQYRDNLAGVRQAIPGMLDLFARYDIKATFGTVGLLFFQNKRELLEGLPEIRPTYKDKNLSPYTDHINTIGDDEDSDIFHYAPSLIRMIRDKGHEISTHTFSHFYCLEPGQNLDQFRADIKAAKAIAHKRGLKIESIIFPRHQFNNEQLKVCLDEGITTYRGNQVSWVHRPLIGKENAYVRRLIRIIDTYINLLGHDSYSDEYLRATTPVNIPASRFLRPWSNKLKFLDGLRLKRILSSMTYAAKNNKTYHLWWHPHNFELNLKENLNFLEKILKHYQTLHERFGFESYSMAGLSKRLNYEK